MNPFDVAVAAIIFGSLTTMVTSYTRMRSKRAEAENLSEPSEERLARIEAAVDAIAVEVERLGESQRYTTNLLADRLPDASSRQVAGGQK